jgi:FecR-like protein
VNHPPSFAAFLEKILRGSFLVSILFLGHSLFGAQPGEARITQVVKDVKILSAQAAPRPATLGCVVGGGTTIRTGAKSRSELTLADQTIARLGANTIVRLGDRGRTLNLDEGAILFQVPKDGGGLQIGTGMIMAASTGATGLIERHSHFYMKFLLLEGEARVSVPNHIGESIVMGAGQILITKPDLTSLPDPAYFDIARVMNTCRLVSEFRPLASKNLIAREEQKQTDLTSKGTYIASNLVIFGRGTLVTLIPPQPAAANERKTAKSPGPTN